GGAAVRVIQQYRKPPATPLENTPYPQQKREYHLSSRSHCEKSSALAQSASALGSAAFTTYSFPVLVNNRYQPSVTEVKASNELVKDIISCYKKNKIISDIRLAIQIQNTSSILSLEGAQ
ncbi:hypothetical protein F442_10015, partial [Phytophthora nicotianae P10297]